MADTIAKGLKTTFLIHAVTGVVFGLAYLLAPVATGDLYGFAMLDPGGYRVLGAALVGFAASSWLAYQADTWAAVRIVVLMEIVWTVVGAIAVVWGIFAGDLPATGWLNFGLLAAFAIAFAFFYMKREAA